MSKGKCNSDEAAIKKEIERRKKISQKKIEKNKTRRGELDEIIKKIKDNSQKKSEACQEYFYAHSSELKDKFGITSWRTLANHCSQQDPNKSRKENNQAHRPQPLAENKCQAILD